MGPSSLIEAVRRHLGGGLAPEPGALRRALAARLTDSRKRRGIRHTLAAVPAAGSFREEHGGGWVRPHPLHPWLDPAVTRDPGVPARRAVAVDGKERKGAMSSFTAIQLIH